MIFLRWIVRIHKWVALIVGLQIVLWISGGVVMSVIPIEVVRGEHKVAARTVGPIAVIDLMPLRAVAEIIDASAIKTATLGEILGKPVWRVETVKRGVYSVDATSGEVLSPVSEKLAQQIAEMDYAGAGDFQSIELLDKPPTEYNRPGPVWRAEFDDRDKTTLYIDPSKGEVISRRSQTWRFYDFFWKLHIMDYNDGAHFNHPLLITAAGAAIFVALSGFILLIIKMRRSLIVWLNSRKSKRIRLAQEGEPV